MTLDPSVGGPPPALANAVGEKIQNSIDAFTTKITALDKRVEHVEQALTSITRTLERQGEKLEKLEKLDSSLASIQKTIDRHDNLLSRINDKLDKIEKVESLLTSLDKTTERHTDLIDKLEERDADMKSNITSLGVKTNFNLLVQLGSVLGVVALLLNLNNTSKQLRDYIQDSQIRSLPSQSSKAPRQ